MKAIVLAAGLGTRLRPFTFPTPKPLLPVWGETMLGRIVSMLRAWGVDDIVVNAHYLHEQVEAWCEKNGCRVSYEPEILGTGGVLNPLREWIGEEDFLLVNGDIVVENIARNPFKKAMDADEIATCLVTEQGPRTIEVEPESGFVTNWRSEDAGFPGTFTYCGIARLKAEILKYVERAGFSTIIGAYERAMSDGKFVRAVSPKGLMWTDAGSIKSFIELNSDGEDNAFGEIPLLKALGVANCSFIGARGSERVFFRSDDGIVVLYDDTVRKENALYAGAARFLKLHGVSVPEVLVDRPELKALVLEYGGVDRKMTLDEYARVIEELVKLNSLATCADLPPLTEPFGPGLWQWERELFEKFCLGEMFGIEMPAAVRKELESVAESLEREPKALVHRDFQSTNILWKNGNLAIIDFQGMRLGPAAYDLASLVYDPYVELTEGERRALVALYAKRSGREEFVKTTPIAAVQRLCQCLGAYGRLRSVGQPQFVKYVVPALQHLLAAADEAGLEATGALAEDLIAAATPQGGSNECSCGHGHLHS